MHITEAVKAIKDATDTINTISKRAWKMEAVLLHISFLIDEKKLTDIKVNGKPLSEMVSHALKDGG